MPYKRGRRVKRRTDKQAIVAESSKAPAKAVLGAPVAGDSSSEQAQGKVVEAKKVPKSIVVRHGKGTKHLEALVTDLRKVMLPYTAAKLKERRNASLKDYTSVAAPLGVTHLLVIGQATKTPTLRVARLPHGPTLTFHISQYSVNKQIRAVQKRVVDASLAYHDPPLVVLNNFEEHLLSDKRHIKMASLVFQSMFPAINVKTVQLANCKRVLLFHLNEEDETIEVRHYFIRTKLRGISKPVKRVMKSKIPDLHDAKDISAILEANAGYPTSDSEFEDEAANVTLEQKRKIPVNFKARRHVPKEHKEESVVQLSEIGPRLTLQLYKVEDGVFTGEVQYHRYETRSKDEVLLQRQKHKEAEELKEQRRQEQEENIKRKREVEEAKKEKRAAKRKRYEERLKNSLNGNNKNDQDESSEDEDDEQISGNEVDEQSISSSSDDDE